MRKKILITGGAGHIGGSLGRYLVMNPDNEIVIVDSLLTGSVNKLPDKRYSNWRFIKADVNNYKEMIPIFTSMHFDFVFHYAAVVGVKRTLENPKMVLNDIDGVKNILNLSKNTMVKRVFFSSSSEVYGEPVEIPQHEKTTPLNSRLPYAIVKNVAEAFCQSYYKEYGLKYTIFRFFNTYGPLQSNDFVVPKFIDLSLRNADIPIYDDGSQTRTFCFIDDNVATVAASIEHDLWINDVVNIGSDVEISISNLAKCIIEKTKSKSKLVYLPPLAEGDMSRRKPDISKMRNVLTRDLISLEEGIMKTVDFIRKPVLR